MTAISPSAATVTSYFLYGAAQPPQTLADNALIRDTAANFFVPIDVQSFMTVGAGRFAVGALSSLVTAFFDAPTRDLVAPGTYTKSELAAIFGISY